MKAAPMVSKGSGATTNTAPSSRAGMTWESPIHKCNWRVLSGFRKGTRQNQPRFRLNTLSYCKTRRLLEQATPSRQHLARPPRCSLHPTVVCCFSISSAGTVFLHFANAPTVLDPIARLRRPLNDLFLTRSRPSGRSGISKIVLCLCFPSLPFSR